MPETPWRGGGRAAPGECCLRRPAVATFVAPAVLIAALALALLPSAGIAAPSPAEHAWRMSSVACPDGPGFGTYTSWLRGPYAHVAGSAECTGYTQFIDYLLDVAPQGDGTWVHDDRPWRYLRLDAQGHVLLLEDYNGLYGDIASFVHEGPLDGR